MAEKPAADIIRTGALCRCPVCEKGPLYSGLLSFQPRCRSCGYDLTTLTTDDGPAAFVMFFVMVIVVPFAGWLYVAFAPSFWVMIPLIILLTSVLTITFLRPAKAILAGFQYHRLHQDRRPGP